MKLYFNGAAQDAIDGLGGTLYASSTDGIPRAQSIEANGVRLGVEKTTNIYSVNASFRNFRVSNKALWSTNFTPPGAVQGGPPEIPSALPSLYLDNADLPGARIGVPYSFELMSRLSMSTYSYDSSEVDWRISNLEAIPAGLEISSSGEIKGTPTHTNDGAIINVEASYMGSKTVKDFTIRVADSKVSSCLEIRNSMPGATSGVYTIESDTLGQIQVYCDMVTDGGDWTLVGRFTNWGPITLPTRNMVVRGDPLIGYSNDDVQYPAFKGKNIFNEIRFDSGNSTWNETYGVSENAGIRIPTKGEWPTISSREDLIAGATRLNGSTDASLSAIAYSSAAWWGTHRSRAVDGTKEFGLFTINDNSGVCGGEWRAGPGKICPHASTIGVNNHFDISTLKYFYGR